MTSASLAQLPALWRERAASLDRYASGAGVALREAAGELETALHRAEATGEARVARVEEFVLTQLADRSRKLTTSELRGAARGQHISNANLGRAIRSLRSRRAIAFEPGMRGARLWFA